MREQGAPAALEVRRDMHEPRVAECCGEQPALVISVRRALAALLSLLMVIAMTGCSSIGRTTVPSRQTVDPTASIPRMPDVVIDGTAGDWGGGGFRVDILAPQPGTEPGQGGMPVRSEFAASMRLGWNEAGLLVLLNVTGADWSEGEKPDELGARDSVEFYLAARPGSSERLQWVMAPGMDPRFQEPRIRLHPFATARLLLQDAPAPTVARRRTDTGYSMEALLPWAALRRAAAPGEEVAFQVMVNNHDRPGKPASHLLWYPTLGAAFDSRRLHRIRLAEKAGYPITARGLVDMDYRQDKIRCDVYAPASATGQTVRVRSNDGVLASGTLAADKSGFARATLAGKGTDDETVYLDVDGQVADIVPLAMPRAEMCVETGVSLEAEKDDGLTAVLGLPATKGSGYLIARRAPGGGWEKIAEDVAAGEFRDRGLKNGTLYEYGILRNGSDPATDYFWTGSGIPLRDRRGTVLLLVEQSQAEPLKPEIRRLMFDLAGDGWQVIRHDVSATQTVASVRELIRTDYDRAPAEVNAILLLGHIPVPYAGHARPDGHGKGAWPADAYYGALEGVWHSKSGNPAGNGQKGDAGVEGQLEDDVIPGAVQLAVGRIDFANMPAFGVGETALLRRYLDRDHAYRHAQLTVLDRAFVHDGFPGHPERFAADGWQNFTTLLDPERVRSVSWPNVKPGMNLLFYACGPGHQDHVQTFGSIKDLVKMPLAGVFTLFFGSVIGDWNTPDNLMRAVLAHENGGLTCGWGGRPHWFLHSMGMGEPIGDALRRTQNNSEDYSPRGTYVRGPHIALMGDPTLRLHRVAPPSALQVTPAGKGIGLHWAASPQDVLGYHVYRSDAEFGPYERLTAEPIRRLSFEDPAGTTNNCYQVRAVGLQQSTTGSYHNNSQGIFAGPIAVTANGQ